MKQMDFKVVLSRSRWRLRRHLPDTSRVLQPGRFAGRGPRKHPRGDRTVHSGHERKR